MNEQDLELFLRFKENYIVGDKILIYADILRSVWLHEVNSFLNKQRQWTVKITYIGKYGFTCKIDDPVLNNYNYKDFSINYNKFFK